jgi:acyl carrier protein
MFRAVLPNSQDWRIRQLGREGRAGDADGARLLLRTGEMAAHVTRLANAIETIRGMVAKRAGFRLDSIGADDDLIDDIGLDEIELESIQLDLEYIFGIKVPDELWSSPLYRTPQSLAEWCIRRSEEAGWAETQRQRKRA